MKANGRLMIVFLAVVPFFACLLDAKLVSRSSSNTHDDSGKRCRGGSQHIKTLIIYFQRLKIGDILTPDLTNLGKSALSRALSR